MNDMMTATYHVLPESLDTPPLSALVLVPGTTYVLLPKPASNDESLTEVKQTKKAIARNI